MGDVTVSGQGTQGDYLDFGGLIYDFVITTATDDSYCWKMRWGEEKCPVMMVEM